MPSRVLSFEQLIADADAAAADESKPGDVRARARAAAAHFRKMQSELTSKALWPMPAPSSGRREEARRVKQMQRNATKRAAKG